MKELKLLSEGEIEQGPIYELIQNSKFLSGLDKDEITELTQWAKVYSAPSGTFVLKEGDESTFICIILEGLTWFSLVASIFLFVWYKVY